MTSKDDRNSLLYRQQLDYLEHLLVPYGLDLLDVTRMTLELFEATDFDPTGERADAMRHCRTVLHAGIGIEMAHTRTLPFDLVIEEIMRSKQHLRLRSLGEMRQYYNRIVRVNPAWRDLPIREISVRDCQDVIESSFDTHSAQRKAMTILRAIFNFGMKRGLCDSNPVDSVSLPQLAEKTIKALSLIQIKELLQLVGEPEHKNCAAAVGIMLWAGVRPTELTRIKWKHINFKDRVISIEPRHAKTGGARLVKMEDVLIKWLRKVGKMALTESHLTPASWPRRWKKLRYCAGLKDWRADVLRHSYASYHLRHFKDLKALQLNMGHTNVDLLRTRYLALDGITEKAAAVYWGQGSK